MYEDALARVDLFSVLRFKELTEVAKCCRVAKYSPGSVLITQGEQGLGLFIITKGTIDAGIELLALLSRRVRKAEQRAYE